MFTTLLARLLATYSLGTFLFAFSIPTFADCSDRRVIQLSEKGRSVASIAKSCKMSKQDVLALLEDEDEGEIDIEEGPNKGLVSGTPVGQCGCWGFVDSSHVTPHKSCQSGYAMPSMCKNICPAGGYAWRGVCT